MYGILYYKIYKFLESKKNHDPVFNAVTVIFLFQILHFSIGLLIVKKITGYTLPNHNEYSSYGKYTLLPFCFIWIAIAYYYFKSKLEDYKEKYKNDKVISNIQFAIYFLVLFLIPLYAAIKLSGGQIWK